MFSIYLWGVFVLMVVLICEGAGFNGGLQLFFLGIPLLLIINTIQKNRNLEFLFLEINDLESGKMAILKMRRFLLHFLKFGTFCFFPYSFGFRVRQTDKVRTLFIRV